MSVLCRLFGHRSSGWGGHGPAYGSARFYTVDNLEVEHWKLFLRCDRCGADYVAGMFHGPLNRPQRRPPVAAIGDLSSKK